MKLVWVQVPVTMEGRIFCICYGLFGVPLILITVADIGKFLSEHIVWLYCSYLKLQRSVRSLLLPLTRWRRMRDEGGGGWSAGSG